MIKNLLVKKLQRKRKLKGFRSLEAADTSSIADVAFLLLIFFIVTSSFIINQGIYLKLPVKGKQKTVREGRLVIIAPRKNDFTVGKKSYSAPELGRFLEEKVKSVPDAIAVISMEPEIEYQRFIAAMDIVKRSGITAMSVRRAP